MAKSVVLGAEALLEREEELRRIANAIAAVSDGHGAIVVVEAPAGLGKTRLLEAAGELARGDGIKVLTARGLELEGEFAFGVVRQLFDPVWQYKGAELFAGAAAPARALFDPEAMTPGGDPSYPLLHGLFWLTARLAEDGPVALCIDDAHWADSSSLRFITFLAARLEDVQVALVVACRPEEASAADRALAWLLADQRAIQVAPEPLSVHAVGQLVARQFGADPAGQFTQACHRSTAGNPFFVKQLITALEREGIAPVAEAVPRLETLGPRGVSRALLLRVAGMAAPVADLARAVAVLGDGASAAEARTLAGLEEPAFKQAADALVRLGVLTRAERLTFVHPIVRQALYADLAPRERASLHASAARVLREQAASTERVAAQLLLSEPAGDPAAVANLRTAASDALARGTTDAAVKHLSRALAEPPEPAERAQVLLELGQAEVLARDPRALDHLRTAAEQADELEVRVQAHMALARGLLLVGRAGEALDLLERILPELDADHELRLLVEAEMLATGVRQFEHHRRVLPLAERLRGEDLPDSIVGRRAQAVVAIEAYMANAPADEVATLARRAVHGGELLAADGPDSTAYYLAVSALCHTGRLEEARACYDAAVTEARRRGSIVGFGIASCFRSMLWLHIGELGRAQADASTSLQIAGEHGWQVGLTLSAAFLVFALVEVGELDAAQAVIDEHGLTGPVETLTNAYCIGAARGMLRAAQGRIEEAIEDLLASGRADAEQGTRCDSEYFWHSHAALLLARQGSRENAMELVREELELSQAFGSRRALGVSTRALGLLEGGPSGLGLLRESVDHLAGSGARLDHAKSLIALGAALRRGRQRSDARGPLNAGLDLAHACGATPLIERAQVELRASGARPRVMRSGIDALTPSERRIAEMVAGGMTNPQVAQALFVTRKTVETHLGSVFRKLDVRSRDELRPALSGAPPPDAG